MIYPNSPIDLLLTKEFSRLKRKDLVLDVGTSQRFAKELARYRPLLEKANYKALGYKPEMIFGEDNCDYDGDIHQLKFKSNSVDMALCIEVIEHVADPQTAVKELWRITKPGGKVILTTPFLTPYHGKAKSWDDFSHGAYPDFWRFTHQGLEYLFRDFSEVEVLPFSSTFGYLRNFLFQHRFYWLDQIVDKYSPIKFGATTFRHLVVAVK